LRSVQPASPITAAAAASFTTIDLFIIDPL
jgi:hypothetical protein